MVGVQKPPLTGGKFKSLLTCIMHHNLPLSGERARLSIDIEEIFA
jgi:hypothetical protein